jgi:hypothetical protein
MRSRAGLLEGSGIDFHYSRAGVSTRGALMMVNLSLKFDLDLIQIR